MKKHITLSLADALWLQGFLASQHDKRGNPIRVETLDQQLGFHPLSPSTPRGHKDHR